MKIGILGWGSLICETGELQIEGVWKEDGPCLPVEFARISKRSRLTLVIHPRAQKVQVLWNIMKVQNMGEAIESLCQREGTSRNYIGSLDLRNIKKFNQGSIEEEIGLWAMKKGFDAVIWTNLKSNFEQERGKTLNEENVIDYLVSITDKREAVEYIKKTPIQIKTKYREVIEKEFLKSICQICGKWLQKGNKGNIYGTENGMYHRSTHHLFPKRFREYFSDNDIKDLFQIEEESQKAVLCFECHEEILHNIVLNTFMISDLSTIFWGESKKERIRLFHAIFKRGIEEQLKEGTRKLKIK